MRMNYSVQSVDELQLWTFPQYCCETIESACLKTKRSLAVLSLGFNFFVACPFYLKRCACCARGPGYLRLGDWYSWDSRAWLVFWLGLLANLTVMGSVAPGGFWQFRPLMASSASTRRSKRMKPTPLETPVEILWSLSEWSFDKPLNNVLTMDQDGTPLQLFLEVLYLKWIFSHLSIVFKGSHVAWLIQTKPIQDITTLYILVSCLFSSDKMHSGKLCHSCCISIDVLLSF